MTASGIYTWSKGQRGPIYFKIIKKKNVIFGFTCYFCFPCAHVHLMAYLIKVYVCYNPMFVGKGPTCIYKSAFRFVNSLVYYGLSLSVGSFGLDIYVTQLIFGAVEVPARIGAMFMVEYFGRKPSQAACLLLGGVVCLIVTAIPNGKTCNIMEHQVKLCWDSPSLKAKEISFLEEMPTKF